MAEEGGEAPPNPKEADRFVATYDFASAAGLNFGYNLGVSGGVTSVDPFLQTFFPSVYKNNKSPPSICKFDNQTLAFFTSSLYLAALVSCLFASPITRMLGRKLTMILCGIVCIAGAILNSHASAVWMLILGRLLTGFGIGCVNRSVPLYVSEIPPYYKQRRRFLMMTFQYMTAFGIFVASSLNVLIAVGWGTWRRSLGGALVPAILLILSSLCLPDSNKEEEESNNVDVAVVKPSLTTKGCRPQLVFAIAIPAFQQLTGMNVINFYAPVLVKTLGIQSALETFLSAANTMVSAVYGGASLVSIFLVEDFEVGRRTLFIEGGIQMFITQVTIGILVKWFKEGGVLPYVLVGLICLYIAGFGWSWGSLGWLVPFEIFPTQVQSAAQSVNVSTSMLFTFLVAQFSTSALCHVRFGLFIFFPICVVIMSVFIYFWLPEIKGIPVEEMSSVWEKHRYWGQFVGQGEGGGVIMWARGDRTSIP